MTMEEFEKGFFEFLMGNPVVFDDKGNLVNFCDIPPAQRIEYIEYKDFTFEELKKAFEDTYQVMNKGNKRAEQAALKAYPKEEGKVWSSAFGTFEFDKTAPERTAYRQGYEQAEKDLALIWEDVAKIITIYEAGIDNGDYRRYNEPEWMKEYSQDILRKFNEQRNMI